MEDKVQQCTVMQLNMINYRETTRKKLLMRYTQNADFNPCWLIFYLFGDISLKINLNINTYLLIQIQINRSCIILHNCNILTFVLFQIKRYGGETTDVKNVNSVQSSTVNASPNHNPDVITSLCYHQYNNVQNVGSQRNMLDYHFHQLIILSCEIIVSSPSHFKAFNFVFTYWQCLFDAYISIDVVFELSKSLHLSSIDLATRFKIKRICCPGKSVTFPRSTDIIQVLKGINTIFVSTLYKIF